MKKSLDRETRVKQINSEITLRVKQIDRLEIDKKNMAAGFSEQIKILKSEVSGYLTQLVDIDREELAEEADEILDKAD